MLLEQRYPLACAEGAHAQEHNANAEERGCSSTGLGHIRSSHSLSLCGVGHRYACKLSTQFRQYEPIGLDMWQAAFHSSSDAREAVLAISCGAMGRAGFRSGDTLDLAISLGPDESAGVDLSTSPMYWLLDSFRGARARIVLMDDGLAEGCNLRFKNGMLMTGRYAIQWGLEKVVARPGIAAAIPIAVRIAGRVSSATDLRGRMVARVLDDANPRRPATSAVIEPGRSKSPSLDGMNLVLPPLNAPGFYEVQLSCADGSFAEPLMSWPIWVADDWRRPVRRHLLGCRDRIEKAATEPWSRSIGVAHVARALAALESATCMDSKLLSLCSDVHSAEQAIEKGRVPPIPPGRSNLSWRLASGRLEPVTIDVPAHVRCPPRLADLLGGSPACRT